MSLKLLTHSLSLCRDGYDKSAGYLVILSRVYQAQAPSLGFARSKA